MQYFTYAELANKVLRDLGLEQEEIVRPVEMLGYCNEAIDEAESEIHTCYEDYFLTSATISLVQGTSTYSLPANIYANKIRAVLYTVGNTIYTIPRIKEFGKFIDIMLSNSTGTGCEYRYFIVNDSAAAGIKLQLVPPVRETSANAVTIWYLRNANRLAADTDICDIPEFSQFVIQWMKMRCYEKSGDSRTPFAAGLVDAQRKQMVETLTAMVPDGDNELEADLSHYRDMSLSGDF